MNVSAKDMIPDEAALCLALCIATAISRVWASSLYEQSADNDCITKQVCSLENSAYLLLESYFHWEDHTCLTGDKKLMDTCLFCLFNDKA